MTELRVLFLGDIFGEPGRRAVCHFVPQLRLDHGIHLVIANGENMAAGRGVTKKLVEEMLSAGVDFLTSGNHVFHVRESYPYLNDPQCKILRPYNFTRQSPGRGTTVIEAQNGARVGLINLMGRIFMEPAVNMPFDAFDEAYLSLQGECDVMVMDFHAETTSEKRAMGWHTDGKLQALVGTHTHVPTADEEILPRGCAYITDLGMCGPYDSVIGMRKDIVLRRMRTTLHDKFEVASGDVRLCGALVTIDVDSKKALSITRVRENFS